jgi:tRNA-specific 2-thiouridylase
MSKRVVVGLSGGVDSSVAAYLLKEQGYEVIGIFMKNWHDETVVINNECPWVEDSNDALIVAEKLGIPFRVLDLSVEYKQRIVDYMFAEYEAGRTPNPDVLCNREIKFDVFLKAALQLGADYVATGHYCQKDTIEKDGKTIHRLLTGKDPNKDQSYFLCQLTQEQLSKALFPIGSLLKPEVRAIAKKLDLITAEKKDSQGLCFVGKIRLPEFLQQQLLPKKGKIIEIDADSFVFSEQNTQNTLQSLTAPYRYEPEYGKVVGEHIGSHFYTIGQRKGLQVGGKPKPLFVIATDVEKNIIYVGQGSEHPGLKRKGLFVVNSDIHWIRQDLQMAVGEKRNYMARIRYRQPLSQVTLHQEPEGLYVIFNEKQQSITPGQFVAWYDGEELIGSGVIA